jgi:molecular chaperone DnaK (HSP70)
VSDAVGLKRVYGIDLGTTYSAIAYVDEHGKAVIVPNQESERITPSVVLFDGDNIIVGNTAKESAKLEPHRVVSGIKQHMGDPNFVFQYEGQAFSPEDISSFMLRKVVGDAQIAAGGEPITDVVITCPAYFGTPEREATANAGRLAGLSVRAILQQSQGIVVYLLPRNTEVPMERISDFGTDADNQAAVDIHVMAGERDSTEPADCQEVGLATLNLPERLPARSPIRVKFAINQDGRLNVSAIDLTAGGSIDVEFQTEAVMNAEEVEERSTALRMLTVS